MKQKSTTVRKKSRRRTRAQVEADRRLTSLRKNLAKEIEADLDRFSGDKPSVTAGLLVLAKMRIILAFLQAFFPMFISAPKPRKIKRSAGGVRGARRTRVKKSGRGTRRTKTTGRKRARVTKGIRIVKLQQADPTGTTSVWTGENSPEEVGAGGGGAKPKEGAGVSFCKDENDTSRINNTEEGISEDMANDVGSLSGGNISLDPQELGQGTFSTTSRKNGKTYFLHSRLQRLKNGQESTLYFFSRRGGGGISEIPAGYEVSESEKTGLPILKKKISKGSIEEK